MSAQFGSGAQLKEKAIAYLTDEELLKQVSAKTAAAMDDAALLKAVSAKTGPFKRYQQRAVGYGRQPVALATERS